MKLNQIFSIDKKSEVNIDDILIFKNQHTIFLSEEYIEFLLEYNYNCLKGEFITINRVFEDGFSQKFYLRNFLTFEEFGDSYLYFHEQNLEAELKQEGVSIIGMTAGRTCICIGITQKNIGQVYLWDGDFGVTKQSDNLQSFFDSLEIDETQR